MSYTTGQYTGPSRRTFLYAALVATFLLVLLIGGCNYLSSFDAPRKGYSAVCQTGGPIEGDSGTCGFLPSGSGKSMIGYENTLAEFPANNRFWRAGNNADNPEKKAKGADIKALELPTSNGGIVTIEYLMRFKLKQDEKSMLDLYKKQATRTYAGGPKIEDDPDKWFVSWLTSQINPTIERRLREEIGPYSCSELNPTCDLTKLNADLEKLASQQKADIENAEKNKAAQGREVNKKLQEISTQVEGELAGPDGEFAKSLEGEFLVDIDFQIIKVNPPAELIGEINAANAALATLVKANANARAETARAKGQAQARREEAAGIRAINNARKSGGKIAAQIEMARALCGEELQENGDRVAKGCPELRAIGGGTLNLNDLNAGKK